MHRITKNKTKALQIAVVAVFMAVAAFAAKPAQAKFGMVGGYKYVGVQGTPYTAHVVQLDFLWTIRGKGKGYRDGGKRPYQVFGFGIAVGGNVLEPITVTTRDLTGLDDNFDPSYEIGRLLGLPADPATLRSL